LFGAERRLDPVAARSANAGGETQGADGMPIDKRVSSGAQALEGVADGATVFVSGFGGSGFPNVLIRALRERAPRDLTLVVNSATHRYSLTHELIEAGLVRKVICSAARGHTKDLTAFEKLWVENRIELELLPQGTMTERIRAGGAGIAAFYTPVGFGTELANGKEVRRFGDRDHVLEQAITGDLALVRADTADRYGNLTFRYAQANFGPVMATAAKLSVAEVRVVDEAPIPHDRVQLSGIYVDRIVAVGS
jgi:3-oxoadipate CoA-transferase alpha subunit